MRKSSQKGFTLIELLVVVAIIGLLASIVIASLNSARQKGRDARRIADVRDIQTALEMYNDSNNGYPASTASIAPTYMQVVPADPTGTYSYQYSATAPGTGVSAPCPQYHFGVTLEVSGSASLASAAHVAAGNGCGGDTDFNASGSALKSCGGTASGSTNQCYDVKVQ